MVVPSSGGGATKFPRPNQPQRHEERKERAEISSLFGLFVSLRLKSTHQELTCSRANTPLNDQARCSRDGLLECGDSLRGGWNFQFEIDGLLFVARHGNLLLFGS